MSLTNKDVEYVAKLSALELNEAETENYKKDLEQILEHFNQLSEIVTDGIPACSHVHGANNAFREDMVKKSYDKEVVEKLAPDFVEGGFRVPKIIG